MGTSVDVETLVIGAGMAGLATAAEIGRRDGGSVAVLEAGPDRGRAHIQNQYSPAEALRLWLRPDTDPDFRRPYESAGGVYRDLAGLRRRVGGRSLYWGGVLLPVERWALSEEWPDAVVKELTETWDGGPSLYERVVDDVVAWGAEAPGAAGLTVGELEFGRTPHATRTEPGGGWSAFSPLAWWDDDGDPRVRRVPILAGHDVLAVRVERGRVTGVLVRAEDGELRDLRAKRVVLAAGTVVNSRLAIQALAGSGADAPRELPGLVDKISQGFNVAVADAERLPDAVRAAAREGHIYHRTGTAGTRSNQFVRFTEGADGTVGLDSWTMGEQRRGPHGRVRCEGGDEWPWPTTVHARLEAADEEVRAAQQHLLGELWAETAQLLGVPADSLEFSAEHGSPDLADRLTAARTPTPRTYSFPLGSEQHEGGTLAFGEVLDQDHQFTAIAGLYACGPSVMPRTGAANPSMTTLALGKRLGAILAG
ncbi:GMC oxidoreductase [Actinacidiphila acididurans]|uniref:GMC family oxidoreductase n=1 Tax=Actinacidiphila acididurans TaxID=2784346 RepID=A0ABS2TKE2_9ACTN|nr:GMC oxidoreductase [Actinacidiphila acididurans]MBM9503805.1 GMC family oxidoreductase [Actinacidiphila acididurans]